ncbi:hypothetical protein G4228_006742 [Cervus hanglu yarkandensis]|nr:hypothetical protein G4228_006742 [Cervus hanglu yarkandensis]
MSFTLAQLETLEVCLKEAEEKAKVLSEQDEGRMRNLLFAFSCKTGKRPNQFCDLKVSSDTGVLAHSTGLGRAPVLVALALIEGGMKYEDAVQFIRQKRRGAFNSKQLLYLEKYCPKMRLRFKDSNGHRNNCCVQ